MAAEEQGTVIRWRAVAGRLPQVVGDREDVVQVLEALNVFVYPLEGLTAEVRGCMTSNWSVVTAIEHSTGRRGAPEASPGKQKRSMWSFSSAASSAGLWLSLSAEGASDSATISSLVPVDCLVSSTPSSSLSAETLRTDSCNSSCHGYPLPGPRQSYSMPWTH